MNNFGYYFKKVMLAMAIWQGAGVVLNTIFADLPLVFALMSGLLMLLALSIPSLIAAFLLSRGESKK